MVPGLRRLTGTTALDLVDIGMCAAAAVGSLLVNRSLFARKGNRMKTFRR